MLQSGFERQELMEKTVGELREICKENGISVYEHGKRMPKNLLVERMLSSVIIESESEDEESAEEEQIEQPVEIENNVRDVELVSPERAARLETERLERVKKYVEKAKVGEIVAFRLPSGKVISAAITRKSTSGRKFLVETKYGAEHKISFDDVLWVRTNKRWPKGIYLLFKQNTKVEVTEDGREIS